MATDDWALQLAELYAEDFVAPNGILAWELATFRSPSRFQLESLAYDLEVPFEPTSSVWRPHVRVQRARYRRITLPHDAFFTATLKSPRRRDFDLYVYRAGRSKPLARSARGGRFDRLGRVLAPGRYDIEIYAYRGDME